MSLLSCLRCTTKFAVGLLRCPHCQSEDFEEADVPKNTVGGGASYPEEAAASSAEPEAAAGPEGAEVSPPPVSAVKAEHVEYAVEALGVPQEEAESMTKPDLVELARTEAAEAERPAPSLSRAANDDG